MPNICESCRFHGPLPRSSFELTYCSQRQIRVIAERTFFVPIADARQICDREGDGVFVHYEPKDPENGAFLSVPPAVAGGDVSEARTESPAAPLAMRAAA